MGKLPGKIALITGGARGIGKAFASRYVREGATVIIADINLAQATKTATEIGKNVSAIFVDVTDKGSIQSCVDTVIQKYGRIDIVINNAGVFSASAITDITESEYQRVFNVNVFGTLFMTQTVAKYMIGQNIKGKIINMASQAGRRGEPLVAVYCASKSAVISLTQSAGLNLIQYGINVNAISPGVVDGEHWDSVDAYFAKLENKPLGQKKQQVGASVPYGRMGTADDLSGMAVFLASEDADYVVAQTYNVDGGNWLN